MNRTIKIDAHAFNRGVDTVLTLRPLREAIFSKSGKPKAGAETAVTIKGSAKQPNNRQNEHKKAG